MYVYTYVKCGSSTKGFIYSPMLFDLHVGFRGEVEGRAAADQELPV